MKAADAHGLVAWELLGVGANLYATPDEIAQLREWRQALVPGTVAQSLGLSPDSTKNLDAQDWWYRSTFLSQEIGASYELCFGGLTGPAEVWFNGQKILSAQNMFREYRCQIKLQAANELYICFKSLDASLGQKRTRPRWKTALVGNQNLRWFRTSLLGRIPAWTPAIAPIGPWKNITLQKIDGFSISSLVLQTSLDGPAGIINFKTKVGGPKVKNARLLIDDHSHELCVDGNLISAEIIIPAVEKWWPHTHGSPRLYTCTLEVESVVETLQFKLDPIGFKALKFDRNNQKVQLSINEVPIFCRGACWSNLDIISLVGKPNELRSVLTLARDSGLNMFRVGGTMVYESDLFYRLCDELGIMVWQEFMFANMDYPFSDLEFLAEVRAEVKFQLERLHRYSCIVSYCGGSEVFQQAAMLGISREVYESDFLVRELAETCAAVHPGIPYFPSSPCEGIMPFQVSEGIAHYYGVGAYRRPLQDVKSARVKFTTECLGFSNVPDRSAMELLPGGQIPAPHHPIWKARVPRDSGAGWDFEDIRDHYTRELFGLDPVTLRWTDIEHYYDISRATSGEVMKSVFAEWRRDDNLCAGGLIWFFKDLWAGAGWGLVDSNNHPKAALYYLGRAWAPQAVQITDQGLDGLRMDAYNEKAEPLQVELGIEVFNHGKVKIASASKDLLIDARSSVSILAEEMLGHFSDLNYAYRFGPPRHNLVYVYLKCRKSSAIISEDFFFPLGHNFAPLNDSPLEAKVEFGPNGCVSLRLLSSSFLQCVSLTANGYRAKQNYFHLAPGRETIVELNSLDQSTQAKQIKVELTALNLRDIISIRGSNG